MTYNEEVLYYIALLIITFFIVTKLSKKLGEIVDV